METDVSVKRRNNPEGRLKKFWPGPKGEKCPIMFVNVVGEEGQHPTGSKDANVGIDSKFNEREAKKAVSKPN